MKETKQPVLSFPSPEPDRVDGLPQVDHESLAILTSKGDVVVARQCRVTTYHLDETKCRSTTETEFREPVTALGESDSGLLAAAGSAIHLVTPQRTQELARVEGIVRSIAVAGTSVYAAVGKQGRLDGTLVEVDLLRSSIVSERSLRSAAVTLSVDATGSFVGIADGTTFRTLQARPEDPCPDRPPAEPPRPDPKDDPCGCHGKDKPGDGKDREPTPPDSHPTPTPDPCIPGQSGTPTPGGGGIVGDGNGVTHHPPGSTIPWDPCRSHLFFEVAHVRSAGAYVVATDREARNVAVLASGDLRVVHEAQYRQGAMVLSHPAQPLMLVFDRVSRTWERKYLDRFEPGVIEIEPHVDLDRLTEMTWVGTPLPVLKGNRAPAIGKMKVLVLPVLDPGQSFNDADLPKLAAYFQRAAFNHVLLYYRENSFGHLEWIDFHVHGVHAGTGGPFRLPKPISEYYNPLYIGAHVDLVKNGLTFPATLVFDGRERFSLQVKPQDGGRKGTTLNVKLAALLGAKGHGTFPVQIRFDGTETGMISVKRPNGANASLNLKFPVKTLDIVNDGDVSAKLADLESYLDGVIALAESTAGISGRLFTKPVMRRIDQGSGFGFLVTTLSHTVSTGPKLEVISTSFSATKDPFGLDNAFTGRMTVSGGTGVKTLKSYLDFVTTLAQEEVGSGHNQRHLAADPVIDVNATTGKLTTSLFISPEDGGPGATMNITNIVEMGALFDTTASVPNTNVTAGRSATPKDGEAGFDGLISDVFTAAVDRLAPPGMHVQFRDKIDKFFKPYQAVIVGLIDPAKTHPTDDEFVRPDEMWSAGSSSRYEEMRAMEAPRTAVFRPHPKDIMFFSNWNFVFLTVKPNYLIFCHELGHAIGFADMYAREAGYRNDLIYLETWAMMHDHNGRAHHCGYNKWQAGWIPDQRIQFIERPKEDQVLVREVLLVPVEHWRQDNSLVSNARSAFNRADLPVVQLVHLDFGGDADLFGLIEARTKGYLFSDHLPEDPAVLVTNCIVWWDPTRYAFNGKYRAPVHLLHGDKQLRNAGDSFDLARGQELPHKGIVVTIVDRKTVSGIEVFHIKVERKHSKEFIDLFFSSSDPYYKNPDVWVDWTGDNGPGGKTSSLNRNDHRRFPIGEPREQGEKIRVPDSGEEQHWIVGRLRNIGNVRAEQVKLNFSICDPPGAGDRGNFKVKDTVVLPEVQPTGHDKPITIPGSWLVPAGFKGHTCILVEVADLKVPLDHTGAAMASDDVQQANNKAQKNVDDIGPKSGSPYDVAEFEFSVNNSSRWPEVAYLEPEGLPYGMRLTISPKRRKIAAGETAIFRCKLELDDKVIDASCRGDHDFRINAWRVEEESATPWGGVQYQVRPRKRSTTDLNGSWESNGDVEITGHVAPGNITGSVRIRLAFTNHHARWVTADLLPGGTFMYKEKAPTNTRELFSIALFEGNKYYSESRSPQRRIIPPPIIA